jgi:DNA-binding XRE family transcriptional regulator
MDICGNKIKSLRTAHGWSQDRLAKVSGLSLRTIQRIERGDACSVESKLSLAATFEVSPQALSAPRAQQKQASGIEFSRFIAFVIVLIMLAWLLGLSGGLQVFFDATSLMATLLLAPCLTVLSKGFNSTLSSIMLLKWLCLKPVFNQGMANCVRTLHKLILHLYASGALVSLLSLIGLLSQSNVNREYLGSYLAIVILPLLYAAIMAELVFRPIKYKAEALICLENEH